MSELPVKYIKGLENKSVNESKIIMPQIDNDINQVIHLIHIFIHLIIT